MSSNCTFPTPGNYIFKKAPKMICPFDFWHDGVTAIVAELQFHTTSTAARENLPLLHSYVDFSLLTRSLFELLSRLLWDNRLGLLANTLDWCGVWKLSGETLETVYKPKLSCRELHADASSLETLEWTCGPITSNHLGLHLKPGNSYDIMSLLSFY